MTRDDKLERTPAKASGDQYPIHRVCTLQTDHDCYYCPYKIDAWTYVGHGKERVGENNEEARKR